MTDSADFWRLAGAACTAKQLRVLELRERHGMSLYQIAYAINVHPSTVRGHLRSAAHNISRAREQQGPSGKGGSPSFSTMTRPRVLGVDDETQVIL